MANRAAQDDKDGLSRRILAQLFALPAYQQARTVMLYIGIRSEVRTREHVPEILASGRRVVVPFCQGDELGLFLFATWTNWKLRGSASANRRGPCERGTRTGVATSRTWTWSPFPGLAFDRRGARLGHGKAYYDRLLCHARPDTALVGLAFECQMFPAVPTSERDVFMDLVITETGMYPGTGRLREPAVAGEE